MVLLLPLLIVFTVKHSAARTHSLRYFRLGVSEPGHGIPEFISVGYVDSHPITTYDSVSRLKEPRAPWMAEHLEPDHWARYTQLLRGWQQTFKVELERLQRHYNHSDNVAHVTKRAWEANWHELQYQKNWLEEECIAWLKRFLEYGKDTLQRTEPPLVKVTRKETFPGVTTLVCRAYGFYPPEISMMWKKNGEEIIHEMDYGDILPSGDGTYQTWVSVELDPQSSDLYSCHVEHEDVQMVLQVPQGSETLLLVIKAVSGFIVLAMVLAGAGFLAWRRRPQENNEVVYLPAPDQ
uniref:Major histocompatibility complex, class I-related n=1 Tax=Pipistrellus kuhlii TaxID=59472 RepID=A0A7J7UTU1_PIPKU|nr:major histocompatibility complex, class I-related [Pipistrellus kuhlii]